jgi:hypothetical protein
LMAAYQFTDEFLVEALRILASFCERVQQISRLLCHLHHQLRVRRLLLQQRFSELKSMLFNLSSWLLALWQNKLERLLVQSCLLLGRW